MKWFASVLPRTALVGLASMLATVTILIPLAHAATQGDCDANAVINCGVTTTQEINQKYTSEAGVASIYHYFGISSTDVDSLHTTAVSGFVTKGGRVLIGDKTVATDALTAGRLDMPGSQSVTQNGTTFYTRPPSVSFQQDKLDAFVVMKDGQFQFAIIKSCGNPVKATPVAPETPPPAPAPTPAPQPTPPPVAPVVAPAPSTGQCRMLNVTTSSNRVVNATVDSSVVNARVTGYTVDFGDGTAPAPASMSSSSFSAYNSSSSGSTSVTTASATTSSVDATSPSVTHQYAKDGTYTLTGYVQVLFADGHSESKTSATCQNSVSFNTPVTPAVSTPPPAPAAPAPVPAPVTPIAVTVLPNTGTSVSQTIGLSAFVGIISSLGYYAYTFWRTKLYA